MWCVVGGLVMFFPKWQPGTNRMKTAKSDVHRQAEEKIFVPNFWNMDMRNVWTESLLYLTDQQDVVSNTCEVIGRERIGKISLSTSSLHGWGKNAPWIYLFFFQMFCYVSLLSSGNEVFGCFVCYTSRVWTDLVVNRHWIKLSFDHISDLRIRMSGIHISLFDFTPCCRL